MNNKFEYEYEAPSIKEREEINNIISKYLPASETMTKMSRLKYLDNKVKSIPQIISLTLGIVGLLIFGTALTFFLEWTNLWYIGIPLVIISVILIGIAYPVYQKVHNSLKQKHKEEILELSSELLNNE